jgi:hypothetical protein
MLQAGPGDDLNIPPYEPDASLVGVHAKALRQPGTEVRRVHGQDFDGSRSLFNPLQDAIPGTPTGSQVVGRGLPSVSWDSDEPFFRSDQRLPERCAMLWLRQEQVLLADQIKEFGPLDLVQDLLAQALQHQHVTACL